MQSRKLGNLTVSAIGIGCMGMTEFRPDASEEESTLTIHRALELGVTFLDTADMYGLGDNEEFLGRAIKGRRDHFVIATKFGNVCAVDGSLIGVNGQPDYVRKCCEASLKRLGVETIDVFFQHRLDPNTSIEDTVGAMAGLVAEGKVRYLGLCEASPATIRRANAIHPITAVQYEYSLWARDVEAEVLPTIRELGIGLVPYSPLGRGFAVDQARSLSDLPSDSRRAPERFRARLASDEVEIQKRVQAVADDKGVGAAQVALAWVLAQGQDIAPIIGTTRRSYLEENVAATEIKLSEADLKKLLSSGDFKKNANDPG